MKLYLGLTVEESKEFALFGKMTVAEISKGQYKRYIELEDKIKIAVERKYKL